MSLSACISVGPSYDRPNLAETQEAFLAADEPIYLNAEREADAWWFAFQDPLLDRVVEVARSENLDLREASARLEAAQAQVRSARRALLPQGSATASVQRQKNSTAAFAAIAGPNAGGSGVGQGGTAREDPTSGGDPVDDGPGTVGGGPGVLTDSPAFELYTVSADLSWELDLFGRLRSQTRQALATAEAQLALSRDTDRLVTARTVEAYLTFREALARTDVARRNLDSQERALQLTQQLVDLGEASEFDLTRQRTQTQLTRANLQQLASSTAEARSALALLTGRTVPALAQTFPELGEGIDLPTPDAGVALSDPAAVLRRRPDVAQAERQLAAATYGIGVQTAQLFPQVTLTGSASLTALSAGGLDDDGAFGYAYGPRLSWPIFSYPQLLAQVDAADAEAEAALYAFQRTVLNALTETDQALVQHARAVDRAELLSGAQESAARSLFLAETRYREGADSLLTFLDAQRTALETEDAFVTARADALRARVAVHRALAD